MAEDTMYPIYRIEARWIQDGEQDPESRRNEGLPPGRILNGTGYFTMLREPDLERVWKEARDCWRQYQKKGTNPSDPEITVRFIRNEAWCGGWFSHWTWDTGQTDEEALASFERFVCRMEDLNRREGKLNKFPNGGSYWEDAYCPMGAQDRYRWCSSPEGMTMLGPAEHGKAPCRCEGCKKNGVIRIDH